MPESDLTKLRRARSRCHLALKHAETLAQSYRDKLAGLEAAIQAIAPELELPVRHRAADPIFARGELTRLAFDVLRAADGPLAIRVIAVRVLALKGIPLPEPTVRRRTRHRLRQMFVALDRRGVTERIGEGNEARRGLADHQWIDGPPI